MGVAAIGADAVRLAVGAWLMLVGGAGLVFVRHRFVRSRRARDRIAGWPRAQGTIVTLAREPFRAPGDTTTRLSVIAHYRYTDPSSGDEMTGRDSFERQVGGPGTAVTVATDPARHGESAIDAFTNRQAERMETVVMVIVAAGAAGLMAMGLVIMLR